MRLILHFLLILMTIIICGCGGGGGGTSTTPPATTSLKVVGTIIDAETGRGIGNTSVALQEVTRASLANAIASSGGDFEVTAQTSGQLDYFLVVKPPAKTDYTGSQVAMNIRLQTGSQATINVGFVPIVSNNSQIPTSIVLTPSSTIVTEGNTVAFQTTVYSKTGIVSGLRLGWRLDGDIGTLSSNGVFTAQHVGNGKITAFIGTPSGLIEAVANVSVESSTGGININIQ